MSKAEQPVLFFATPGELGAWMDEHGEESDGIWLKFAKKASGIQSVRYAEAVEIALCHGWIDGQAKRLDEHHYLQRFTPRRPRSKWSKINRQKAERLIVATAAAILEWATPTSRPMCDVLAPATPS